MNKYLLSMLLLVIPVFSATAAENTKEGSVTVIKTEEDYEKFVTKSVTPVVIDFYAPWCQPCSRMSPIFEKIAKEFPEIRFVKINTDNEKLQNLITQFSIRSIPTFVFKKGQATSKHIGTMKEEEFRKKVRELMSL